MCLPVIIKQITIIICLFGGLVGFFISNINLYKINKSFKLFKVTYFLSLMWFMPYIITNGITIDYLELGREKAKVIDQG